VRSWLYTPANTPNRMIQAGMYGSDGIIFDLEDAVALSEKDEARLLLEGLLPLIRASLERTHPAVKIAVRINGLDTPYWQDDLKAVVGSGGAIIRVPKVESAAEVEEIAHALSLLEAELHIPDGSVHLQVLLETPRGVEEAFRIGAASPRVIAFSFGAEDYCSALGIHRNGPRVALDYPRARIASAASACGIEAYDAAYGFLDNADALVLECAHAKALGFHGKSAIHPKQVAAINGEFSFSAQEVREAKAILASLEKNQDGVSSLEGRMIDKPVIAWAHRVLAAAEGNR